MNEIELVLVGSLDRRNRTERTLDGLLYRLINKESFNDSEPITPVLIDAYLAVVRSRNKCHRGWDKLGSMRCEFAALTRLTKKNQLTECEELVNQAMLCAENKDYKGVVEALNLRRQLLQTKINEEQTRIAETKRNGLLKMRIHEIARNHFKRYSKKCTFEDLTSALQSMEGDGVIVKVDPNSVVSSDPDHPRKPNKTTSTGTLRNILTQANKKALENSRI
jgi:hypothetical protein